jgi:hypothetical protein
MTDHLPDVAHSDERHKLWPRRRDRDVWRLASAGHPRGSERPSDAAVRYRYGEKSPLPPRRLDRRGRTRSALREALGSFRRLMVAEGDRSGPRSTGATRGPPVELADRGHRDIGQPRSSLRRRSKVPRQRRPQDRRNPLQLSDAASAFRVTSDRPAPASSDRRRLPAYRSAEQALHRCSRRRRPVPRQVRRWRSQWKQACSMQGRTTSVAHRRGGGLGIRQSPLLRQPHPRSGSGWCSAPST